MKGFNTIFRLGFVAMYLLMAILFSGCSKSNDPEMYINYFTVETNEDGALEFQFYVYEDMSGHLGTGTIGFDCQDGGFFVNGIGDLSGDVVISGVVFDQGDIEAGMAYILDEVASSLNSVGTAGDVRLEWRPASLYSNDHPSTLPNLMSINAYGLKCMHYIPLYSPLDLPTPERPTGIEVIFPTPEG